MALPEVGGRVQLTIRNLGRPAEDLEYLRRQGKYADPKYGPTLDGTVLEVAGIVGGYVQLKKPGDGRMQYLADPSELSDPPLHDAVSEWDEKVESGELEQRERPFDAGLHLAAARVVDEWEGGELAERVNELRETLEQMIDQEPA